MSSSRRTKGLDTISSVNADAVRAIAERSDALFHLVMMETAFDNETRSARFSARMMGLLLADATVLGAVPATHLVGPAPVHQSSPDGEALGAGREATGGALHKARMLTEPTLAGTFKKAFEDFRNSYVLRYTPQGVPRRRLAHHRCLGARQAELHGALAAAGTW